MPFITFAAAAGYILELVNRLEQWYHFDHCTCFRICLDLLLYFFVLLPLKSAEVSLAYTDESLMGQVGKVIVPVPVDGYGEIVIETVNGLISKRAAGYENTSHRLR